MATQSIGQFLANYIAWTHGVRGSAFAGTLNAFVDEFTSNSFSDAQSICTYGIPGMDSLFATMGQTGAVAMQTVLSLLAIADEVDFVTGLQYVDRGTFLQSFSADMVSLLGDATRLQIMGTTIDAVRKYPLTDRLAWFLNVLRQLQILNPGSYSQVVGTSVAIRFAVDLLYDFDQSRLALQATVPCPNPPKPIVPMAMFGPGAMPNFVMDALGTVDVIMSGVMNMPVPQTYQAKGTFKASISAMTNVPMPQFII